MVLLRMCHTTLCYQATSNLSSRTPSARQHTVCKPEPRSLSKYKPFPTLEALPERSGALFARFRQITTVTDISQGQLPHHSNRLNHEKYYDSLARFYKHVALAASSGPDRVTSKKKKVTGKIAKAASRSPA